jgi:hypothetical protein
VFDGKTLMLGSLIGTSFMADYFGDFFNPDISGINDGLFDYLMPYDEIIIFYNFEFLSDYNSLEIESFDFLISFVLIG